MKNLFSCKTNLRGYRAHFDFLNTKISKIFKFLAKFNWFVKSYNTLTFELRTFGENRISFEFFSNFFNKKLFKKIQKLSNPKSYSKKNEGKSQFY